MNNDNHNLIEMRRGTAREWAAAKIVLIAGFVIAIAVAGWFGYRSMSEKAAEQQASIQEQQQEEQAPARAQQSEAEAKDGMMVCAQELLNAKNIGIIPPDGQLSAMQPQETSTKGRYACQAATSMTKYIIAADLVCRTLTDSHCVAVYSVKSSDGTVLYQRQD